MVMVLALYLLYLCLIIGTLAGVLGFKFVCVCFFTVGNTITSFIGYKFWRLTEGCAEYCDILSPQQGLLLLLGSVASSVMIFWLYYNRGS